MNTILKNNIVEGLISVIIWTVVLFFTAPILFVMAVAVFIGLLFSYLIVGDLKGLNCFIKQTKLFALPVVVSFIVGYGVGDIVYVSFNSHSLPTLLKIYGIGCIVGSMYFNFYNKK
jgi:hypothetical protein